MYVYIGVPLSDLFLEDGNELFYGYKLDMFREGRGL